MGAFKKGLQPSQLSCNSTQRYFHVTGGLKHISYCTFHIAWRIWIKFRVEYHQIIRRTILRFVKTSTIGVLLLEVLKYFSTTFCTSFVWFRYNSLLWYVHKNFLVISFLKSMQLKSLDSLEWTNSYPYLQHLFSNLVR